MEEEETVTIDKFAYEQLLADSRFLNCLEQAGVDNWEGYSHAHEILDEWNAEAKED